MAAGRAKRAAKACVDVLMGAALIAIMATFGREAALHEYFGVALFVLFLAHQVLNFSWWRGIFRGRYTGLRVASTIVDALLVVGMAGLIASSLILSEHAFAWLPALPGAAWARSAHMLCSYWFFLLAFFHAGLHARLPKRPLRGASLALLIAASLAVLAAAAVAFASLEMAGYLFLQVHFAWVDYMVPIWQPILQNALVALGAACLGFWAKFLLSAGKATEEKREVRAA